MLQFINMGVAMIKVQSLQIIYLHTKKKIAAYNLKKKKVSLSYGNVT